MIRREDGGVYTPPGILTSKNGIKLKPEPGIASDKGDKRKQHNFGHLSHVSIMLMTSPLNLNSHWVPLV